MEDFKGLYIHGVIEKRSYKKYDEKIRVTYKIKVDEEHYYYVDEWKVEEELENSYSVGEKVDLNVYAKAYKKKDQSLNVSFTICDSENPNAGIVF